MFNTKIVQNGNTYTFTITNEKRKMKIVQKRDFENNTPIYTYSRAEELAQKIINNIKNAEPSVPIEEQMEKLQGELLNSKEMNAKILLTLAKSNISPSEIE